jgi:choice-of-anchor B domain-containing protein
MLRFAIAPLSLLSLCGSSQSVDLLGYLHYPVRASNLWGYTDSSGKEYALIGLLDGTSIVDISTDSTNPTELFHIPGATSIWREMKTWNDHAYVVTEGGGGLQIIDLSNLPQSVDTFYYSIDSVNQDTLRTAHTIFIDENGFAYLFGSNLGTHILDLNPDPKHPVFAGVYGAHYVHDGFVRGDTLWASEIGNGLLTAVDVSDKANPVILGTVMTPRAFTHNCWLSSDGQYAFTTDERGGAPVTSFDVSDVSDMVQLDQLFSHPGTQVIPHNTYWLDDYLVTAWYKDGVVLADAHRPENMVVTGGYDTSPFPPEDGFSGCWGVYPFFPSGKIIASDIQEGLFVLRPHYRRACYLEGTTTEATSGLAVSGARVDFVNTSTFDSTNIIGEYKTGVADSGLYDVRFSHPNCQTLIVQDVSMQAGQVTTLHVQLNCAGLGIAGMSEREFVDYDPSTGLLRWCIQRDGQAELRVLTSEGRIVFDEMIELGWGSRQLHIPMASGLYVAVVTQSSRSSAHRFCVWR